MVRLIAGIRGSTENKDHAVSIPKMVRLIVIPPALEPTSDPCFNSKDGAIDRECRILLPSPSYFVSIPKMVRLIVYFCLFVS